MSIALMDLSTVYCASPQHTTRSFRLLPRRVEGRRVEDRRVSECMV